MTIPAEQGPVETGEFDELLADQLLVEFVRDQIVLNAPEGECQLTYRSAIPVFVPIPVDEVRMAYSEGRGGVPMSVLDFRFRGQTSLLCKVIEGASVSLGDVSTTDIHTKPLEYEDGQSFAAAALETAGLVLDDERFTITR